MAPSLTLMEPLNDAEKEAVVQCFWRSDDVPVARYASYFAYYEKERRLLNVGPKATRLLPRMCIKTHEEVRSLATLLSTHRNLPLSEICEEVRNDFPEGSTEGITLSIYFALRVWLTINVRERNSRLLAGNTPIRYWDDQETNLINFVGRQFTSPDPAVKIDDFWINHRFTAHNLAYYRSVKIEWTECLADHLKYDEQNGVLRVYYFQRCLYDHSKTSGTSLKTSDPPKPVYSKEILDEAVATLVLLFPPDDQYTNDFLKKEQKTFHNEPPADAVRNLNLNDYKYWGVTLLKLHKLFMEAEQKSFSYAFSDKSNTLQLYTLYSVLFFSVITLIFGIISSVTAIISTKASLQALQIAREAWDLQLAQAQQSTSAAATATTNSR